MTTDSTKKACVFCNGPLKKPTNVKQIANDCDLLIAADGGAKHFFDIEITPQVIIGDMDSIDSDMWENKSGIEYIRYPADKDKSDAELAVEYALEHGNEQVILVAATGSRLDHTLGNIGLVAGYPGRVAIFDGTSTLVAVDKSERCVLHGRIGAIVSLMPYSATPLTVRTKGLKYSLQDECLISATHGLSNELSQTEACICVSDGILLVYIENQGISHQVSLSENNERK